MIEINPQDEITLLDYAELAEMLGVGLSAARSIVKAGDIPLIEVTERKHRVSLASVKRYLNRGGRRANV